MLVIRLTRKGKKNQPFFRVVVTDKRNSPKGGNPVEILGFVDPLIKRKSLKKDRILYWLSKGAKTSPRVNNLLVEEKIIEGKKIHVSRIKKSKEAEKPKEKETAPVKAETPVAPKAAVVKAETPKEEIKEEKKEKASPESTVVTEPKKEQ